MTQDHIDDTKRGKLLTVPLMMMDDMQRAVSASAPVYDAFGRRGLHQPGYAYAAPPALDSAPSQARDAVYEAYEQHLCSAWRTR